MEQRCQVNGIGPILLQYLMYEFGKSEYITLYQ